MSEMSFLVCCLLPYTAGKGEEARTLKVGEVGLLVERGRLETERVDDVVDLSSTVVEGLLGLLGGSVGTDVYMKVLAGGFPAELAAPWKRQQDAIGQFPALLWLRGRGDCIPTVTPPSVIMAQSIS